MQRNDDLGSLFDYELKIKSAKEADAARQQIIDALIADGQSPSGKRYNLYREKLDEIRQTEHDDQDDQQRVSKMMVDLLKLMVKDALVHNGLPADELIERGDINLCVAGSLAKSEATAFSDIDCFVLLNERLPQDTQARIQHAMQAVCRVTDLLFQDKLQFCMDPLGLSLERLTDTPANVISKIKESERDDLKIAMMSAVSVMGGAQSKNELDMMKTELQRIMPGFVPAFFFQLALDEFKGPRMTDAEYSIKRDIIRPVDFIFQGLMMQANLNRSDYHDANEALLELYKLKIIDQDIAQLIGHLKDEGLNIRKFVHLSHGKEHEGVARTAFLEKRVALVALLRGSVDDWMQQARTGNKATLKLSAGKYLTGGDAVSVSIPDLQKLEIVHRLISEIEKVEVAGSGVLSKMFKLFDDPSMKRENFASVYASLREISSNLFNDILNVGSEDAKRQSPVNVEKELQTLRDALLNLGEHNPKIGRMYSGVIEKINEAISEIKQLDLESVSEHHMGQRG